MDETVVEIDLFTSASELRKSLDTGEITSQALVRASLDRISTLNDSLKAFVTINTDGALERAHSLDGLEPSARGPLHGLPVAIKDLTDTAGLRTTYGSRVFAQNIPDHDDHVVTKLKAAGAVIIGKTNTPEFGFGAVCTNGVLGTTRNPHDPNLTSGGSSGGSAVAVATGMVPLAHGTDFGGSVRTPSSFCGTVAFRPTPGAIASPGRALGWDTLSTHGVMGRTVYDCAAMFKAMSGGSGMDPTSFEPPSALPAGKVRLAQTPDFDVAPLAEQVRSCFREAIEALSAELGPVAEASIACEAAGSAFRVLRAAHVHKTYGRLLAEHHDALMPTARWNIENGQGISAEDYLEAQAQRTELYRRFMVFFETCDVLVAPAASVLPWPVDQREVLAIDEEPLADVLEYLAPTYIVSLVGCPVLSLPAPVLSNTNLPFGIQLIGRPGSDHALLAFGAVVEQAGFGFRKPDWTAQMLARDVGGVGIAL